MGELYNFANLKVREANSYKDLYVIAIEELEKANLEIDRLKVLLFRAANELEDSDHPDSWYEAVDLATHIRRVVTQ